MLRTLAAALVIAAGTSGCGDDGAPERDQRPGKRDAAAPVDASARDAGQRDATGRDATQTFVGEVEGSEIRVGALIEAGRARIFFCGGPSNYATATHWQVSELDTDGAFSFADDQREVSGRLDGDRLQGELIRHGHPPEPFDAQRVVSGTLAGLYEAQSDCGRVGLIVAQRSRSAMATGQGACVGAGHAPQQVNPILPLTSDDDGAIEVEVQGDEGAERVRVQRAAPP